MNQYESQLLREALVERGWCEQPFSSPGADVYDGGIGLDVMSYAQSATGVTVDLQAARGYGGDAAGDVLEGGGFDEGQCVRGRSSLAC